MKKNQYLLINEEINKKKTELLELKKKFRIQSDDLNNEISRREKMRDLLEEGLPEKAAIWASEVITIRSKEYYTKDVTAMFHEAIEDIRTGANILKKKYFGVKEYGPWNSQSVCCEYGMGPSYGHVWFKIGLNRDYADYEFTEEELISMIQFLKHQQKKIESGKFSTNTN